MSDVLHDQHIQTREDVGFQKKEREVSTHAFWQVTHDKNIKPRRVASQFERRKKTKKKTELRMITPEGYKPV
jgi:hypothetical protein